MERLYAAITTTTTALLRTGITANQTTEKSWYIYMYYLLLIIIETRHDFNRIQFFWAHQIENTILSDVVMHLVNTYKILFDKLQLVNDSTSTTRNTCSTTDWIRNVAQQALHRLLCDRRPPFSYSRSIDRWPTPITDVYTFITR